MAVVKKVAQVIEFTNADTLPVVGVLNGTIATNTDTGIMYTFNGTSWVTVDEDFNYHNGYWDYNDAATAITPFSVTGGAGYVNLPNDGAGVYSQDTYKPTGMGDIWIAGESAFDLSGLSLGSEVSIRFTASVTTTVVNTDVGVRMQLGGVSPYFLTVVTEQNIKTAGTYQLSRFTEFYIGNTDTRDSKAYIQIQASDNVSVVVEGWYISVKRR